MLESLLLIFFVCLGAILVLISLIFLILSLMKNSSKLRKIGLGIGVIPIFFLCLIIFWYKIATPYFNKNQMESFSGIYQIQNLEEQVKKENSELKLLSDGTYKFDGNMSFGLGIMGTWKTGGIDGTFDFYNEKGKLIDFASPFGGNGNEKIIFNLYGGNEVRFIKIRNE